jgi:hypothetical protein
MEALIFALIARRNGYTRRETFVPEPSEFQPSDLRALSLSDDAEDTSPGRTPKTAGRPSDSDEQFLERQVGAFLSCRRVISEITGVKRDWGPLDSAQLVQRLARRGFGYLSATYLDLYVREHFRELI